MRLAVLDTNVIVSAAINANGAPAKLVMDWILDGQLQVVTSPPIVAEYREVVRREKFARYGFPPEWLEFMIDESLHLPDPDSRRFPLPDPKDRPFLALAHKAGAWLITGNLKHYPRPARKGVTVLSPADYLTHLLGNDPGAELLA